nr:hypothetical protein [uncultured Pseudomonas sp.]
MEKQKKVERWSYPFKAKGSNGAASSEVIDPQVYYDALATAESGYYPVSSNGLWHGGVHFDQNTAGMLDQSSVRCIADGVVVAYRIDESYKELTYTGGGTCREVTYSTGFVLVRHRLELPPAPAATPPAGGTPAPATPPAPEPDLTFYSLYMHLKDWESYKQEGAPTPPSFLCPTRYAVSEEHATNDFAGLYVRGGAPGTPAHANKVSIIPKGCKVQVGAASAVSANWRKLVSILEGQPSPALATEIEHWVFIGEMTPTQSSDVFLIGQKANDVQASLLPGKGLTVRKEAKHNSAAMAVLPVGTELQLEDGTGKYRKIKSITASSLTAPVSPECAANIQGFVHFDSLKAVPLPPTLNAVHVLPEPVPIAAGALIGHLGKYQAASQGQAHDLLHLEVFSCDNVENFVAQSRARANLLKPEQKALLKIPSDTQVITREDASQTNLPLVSDPGKSTAYDIIIPLAVLNALPAERKITVTTTTGGTTTTEQWWKLDRLPGKDGNEFSGWVKEQELLTPRLHPWDWDGFDFIKETSTLDQQYLCKLSTDGVLDDGEKTNYKAQVNAGDGGAVKERLYEIVDVDGNEKLTPTEIKKALAKPWHAQSISRLIAQYESEWYADEGLRKWDALNCYMTKESEVDWTSEKQRIRSLLWWNEAASLLPESNVWHINPVSLSSLFKKPTCQCKAVVKVTRWNNKYGPVHWGTRRLSEAEQWEELLTTGQVSSEEKQIICVMTENEGKIEAVQSYDSELITAGAMQKTVNPSGAGELPAQVLKFKNSHPSLYAEHFEARGWHLDTSGDQPEMYYQSDEWENGDKLEGEALKDSLRKDCSAASFNHVIDCLPVASMACAISTPEYITLQIMDFIERLRRALSTVPTDYSFTAGTLFKSKLGKALVLDEHINRPGNVADDIGKALDDFFAAHPNISKQIATWGSDHTTNENRIISLYGPHRNMTDASGRYEKLKLEL